MRPSKTIYICTFLLAGSVLLLEIALTRVFSVLAWHHFTYMIISIALLGFGTAGSYLTLRGRREESASSPRRLSRYAFMYAFTTIVSLLLVIRIQFEPFQTKGILEPSAGHLLSLILYYFLLIVPLFFAGLCLGSIFAVYSEDIHWVYAADLLGASGGSLLSVLAIQYLGAVNTIFLVALLAGLAGWMLRISEPQSKPALGPVLVGILALCFAIGLIFDPFYVYATPSKSLSGHVSPKLGRANLDFSQWHTIARVDVTTPIQSDLPELGGDVNPQVNRTWEYRYIFQDGAARTGILKSDGDMTKLSFLDGFLQAAPYQIQENPQTLVIGVGGGLDVLIALYYQADHIVGVDVNPVMVEAITQVYDDYGGGIFTHPRVEILAAEGRHFLSRDKKPYDIIQLSAVDTYAALSSGAYALAENYLYTVEAMEDFWEHLTPNGILSFSRWYFVPPRETFRVVAMMVEALENQGIENPAQHIAIINGPEWAETMMKKSPYTEEEIAILRQWAQENGFDMLYDPLSPQDSEYNALVNASRSQREDFYREYIYNVRPSTDDRPFFFNYYNMSNLFKLNVGKDHGYLVSRMPLGQLTLLLNLVQILLLAGFGILYPLRKLRQSLFVQSGSLAALAYFCALGLGFIFVEITLIQRLMVFLGGPAYSLSLTLFAILLFSGLGSFVARRWDFAAGKALLMLAGAIVGLILLTNFALPWAISYWLDYSLVVRGILAVLLIAPLAFTMGMPFPTGIKILSRHRPEWIPWAWATNSFMTVFGSVFCIFLSMQLGFRWVFIVAGLIYLAGFLAFYRLIV